MTNLAGRLAMRGYGDKVLTFDGVNDYVDFGTTAFNFERTQAFSASIWVNMTSASGSSVLFGRALAGGTFQGWWMRQESDKTFNVFMASDYSVNNHMWVRSSTTPAAGQINKWIRFGFSYDGSSTVAGITLYINGLAISKTTVRDTLTASIVSAGVNARMGTITDSSMDLDGYLIDAGVASRVWTAAEHLSIHSDGVYPSDSLYAQYKFTEGTGSTIADSSGNARTGTITAATWNTDLAPLQQARRPINGNYTKNWIFNGTTSSGATGSALAISAVNKLVIDFWFNPASLSNSYLFTSRANYGGVTDALLICLVSNKISARMANTGGEANWSSATIPPLNQWLHCTAVFDRSLALASQSKIYLNGVLNGANATATGATAGNFGSYVSYVGSDGGTSQFFSGNMKDLRVTSFTGTFADADAISFYQGIIPSGYTAIDRWIGEDASSTATDSVSSNSITLSNVTYGFAQPSKIRQVVNSSYTQSWGFNASTSTATSASSIDFSGGKKYVFDFWYLMRNTGGAAEILTNNTTATASPSGTFKILRGNTLTNLVLQWNDAGGSQIWTAGNLPLNQWAHVTVVIDTTSGAKVCKLLFNGALNGSLTTNTATGGSFLTNDTLRVDKSSGGTGAGLFDGLIKDLKMSTFTGTWADADAIYFYQGIVPNGYTAVHRWIGEDAGASAADSVGAIALTLTANTYTASYPSKARSSAATLQNLVLQSQTFDSASWTKTQNSITANTSTAPDGTATADRTTMTASAAVAHYLQQGSLSVFSNNIYTFSVYAKYENLTYLIVGPNFGFAKVWFNVQTGVIGSSSGSTIISSKIESADNGYYRCSVTFTGDVTATNAALAILYFTNADAVTNWAAAGTETMLVWGAQITRANWNGVYTATIAAAVNTGPIRSIV